MTNDTALRAFLFADLRDYTAFVEREGDRAAADLIADYRRLIRDRLARHDGAELKTEGDSFYIAFPSPSRAIAFGADIFQAAHAEGARRIRFGVGIHAGETVPLEGQFVGSAVNVAARVGAMAGDGELLVTDTVRALVRTGTTFPFEDRGPVALKGVSEPIHLYAVHWRPVVAPAEQPALRREVPAGVFVGRDTELATLTRAAEDLAEGRGRTFLVGGTAGLGKTRLVREWSSRSELLTLLGGCGATDAHSPYEPFAAMLRELTRLPAEEARLRRVAPELLALLPELTSGERPRVDRESLYGAFLRLVRDLLRAGPVCIVADDLHWADDTTLGLFRFLASVAESAPFVLAGTYRDDELQRGHPLRPLIAELARRDDVSSLTLRPLGTADAERLLAQSAERGAIGGADRERIVGLAEGNPLFLEELARSAGAEGALPATVAEAVLRRLSSLDEDGRRLVTYAAIGGQQVGFDLLERVLGLPEREILGLARAAIERSLLVESGEGVAFRHALTREAVTRDLMRRERRLLHREVADALIGLHGEDPATAAEIERQLVEAGLGDRAVPFALRAGDEALRLLAPGEAIAHFERAVDGSPAGSIERARALEGLGAAYQLRLDVTKAVATFEEAVALYRTAGTATDVLRAQVALARSLPYGPEERAAWKAAWAAAGDEAPPAQLAMIAGSVAARAFEFMDDDEAIEWSARALELAERSNVPGLLASARARELEVKQPRGWHRERERGLAVQLDRAIDRDTGVLVAYRRFLDSRSREADADERSALLARARTYAATHLASVPHRALAFRAGPPWMLWLTGEWGALDDLWAELQRQVAADDVADVMPDTGPLAAAVRVEREGPSAGDPLRDAAARQARTETWHGRVAATAHLANLQLAEGRKSEVVAALGQLFARRSPRALDLSQFLLAARATAAAALRSGAAGILRPWLAADADLREDGAMFAAALDHLGGVDHALRGDRAAAIPLLAGAAERYGALGWHHLAAELAWQRARAGDESGMADAIEFYSSRGAAWRARWLNEERWR
ncbi:MAG TPA: AAA family ATPase [Candidatus Saccharimonadales bacterium]|nr:AAA family ATPase [Candidatus Saccharimonadales bacterium]